MSGLPDESLSGPHFAIARTLYYRRIGSSGEGFLNVPTYAGVSLELGNVWERRSDIDVESARFNGAAFLGFDSFLGPIYLAAGLDEDEDLFSPVRRAARLLLHGAGPNIHRWPIARGAKLPKNGTRLESASARQCQT